MVNQVLGVSEATPDAGGNRVHASGDRAPVDGHRGLHRGRRTAHHHRSLHPLHQISDQAPSLGKIRGSRRQLQLFGPQTGRMPPPNLPVGAHQETQPPRQQRGRRHGRRTCPDHGAGSGDRGGASGGDSGRGGRGSGGNSLSDGGGGGGNSGTGHSGGGPTRTLGHGLCYTAGPTSVGPQRGPSVGDAAEEGMRSACRKVWLRV